MSAMPSPGDEMLGLTPLASMPWPHSWPVMDTCSEVFRHWELAR